MEKFREIVQQETTTSSLSESVLEFMVYVWRGRIVSSVKAEEIKTPREVEFVPPAEDTPLKGERGGVLTRSIKSNLKCEP